MTAAVIERTPDAAGVTVSDTPAAEAEAITLGLSQLQRLSDMLYVMTDADHKADGLLGELIACAENACWDCVSSESKFDVSDPAVLWSQAEKIKAMINAACFVSEHGPREDTPDVHAALLPIVSSFASDLLAGLACAPGSMEPLRALAAAKFAATDLPEAEPAAVINAAARNEEFYYQLGQAMEVLRSAAHDNPESPALWALWNLADRSCERTASAMKARDARAFDVASATVQSLLDLMEGLDAEDNGSTLFYAAQTILSVAKNGLDAEWKAVEVEAEAAHV